MTQNGQDELYDGADASVLDTAKLLLDVFGLTKSNNAVVRNAFDVIKCLLPQGSTLCTYDKAVAWLLKNDGE
jgi:hypothetical protein